MNNIGITIGDPKGVGPEIVAKAYGLLKLPFRDSVRIYGDQRVLADAFEINKTPFNPDHFVITSNTGRCCRDLSDKIASEITIKAIERAVADAIKGNIAAIVTAPVNKHRMRLSDPEFAGHTEMLADLSKAKDVTMMFSSLPENYEYPMLKKEPLLRVSFVTNHIPIKAVSQNITKEKIFVAIDNTAKALRSYFGIKNPKIGVIGLNPHAGDNAAIGSEENEIIIPAINNAKKSEIDCIGPLSPDTIFQRYDKMNVDGWIAMYHDQGLIPVKLLAPNTSVNITLGLPFIRTSPAHGTAEDIAWKGVASETNMLAAIMMGSLLTVKTCHPALSARG